jgi:hypothetical protein
VYRTYDTYIKDESSSKQKITKKKSSDDAFDGTTVEK